MKNKMKKYKYKVHVGFDGFGKDMNDVWGKGYVYFKTLERAQKFTSQVAEKTGDILCIELLNNK